ncbi:TIGR00269 family protein [[Eubacterium] cellulosolvens]
MKCDLCKTNDSFYKRFHEGVTLCKRCFRKNIENKVRKTISEYNMLSVDDHIAVAVSGGKDSLSLLHILKKLVSRYPQSKLTAIAIDEGVKLYRDEALNLAEKFSRKRNIPFVVLSFKEFYGYTLDELVRERDLQFPCSVCGVLRRRAIEKLAQMVGANKIATAHNLDDEVQTFLLNIFHGNAEKINRTGPILSGISGTFLKKIKPFCRIPEREIVLYAYISGIDFQSITCPYAGTAFRNDLRKILELIEKKHPGSTHTAFHSIEKIRSSMKNSMHTAQLCAICHWPSSQEVCSVCKLLSKKPLSPAT